MIIEVDNLVKIFPTATGEKTAVDHLSFAVSAGEIYGLLGPNGAGKTTTLRILSGLIKATSGRVQVAGIDVEEQPLAVKRRLGFLNASTGLYQRLSARELLRYFGRLQGLERRVLQSRIDYLIDWLDMHSFADLRCGGLSTGQRQRVSIARAMVGDPDVLILDEPTLGLDVITNRLVLDFITEAAKLGKTIIFSTHYLDEAELLCHRFGLIFEGKLIADGTLGQLREKAGEDRLTTIFLKLCGAERHVLKKPATAYPAISPPGNRP